QGTGAWTVVADSVPNTGTYAWSVPLSLSTPADFRISSVDYVWGDSTVGKAGVAIRDERVAEKSETFAVRAGQLVIPGATGYDRLEVRDASGRTVRVLSVAGAAARWDLTGADGARVPPGLYAFRLTGAAV